jgi:hypothetical protein
MISFRISFGTALGLTLGLVLGLVLGLGKETRTGFIYYNKLCYVVFVFIANGTTGHIGNFATLLFLYSFFLCLISNPFLSIVFVTFAVGSP